MNTPVRLVGLAAAGLAAVSVLSGPGVEASRPSQAPEPRTQRLTISTPFEGGDFHYVDVGKKDIGPGDMFTIVGLPVRNEATGQRIGVLDGLETVLSARNDGTVSQQMTFRFRGGTVTVAGILRHTDKPIRLPVVGGTGKYLGVSGQMREIREDPKRNVSISRLVLHR